MSKKIYFLLSLLIISSISFSVSAHGGSHSSKASEDSSHKEESLVTKLQSLDATLSNVNTLSQKSTLNKVTAEKKEVLKELMRVNPALFNALVVKAPTKTTLARGEKSSLGGVVTVTGKTEVVHIDDFKNPEKSYFQYKINTKGKKYSFYPSADITISSGATVQVTGYAIDDQMTANLKSDGKMALSVLQTPTSDSVGDQKSLVILVKESASDSEPFTPAEAQDLVFNGQFQNFMKDQSYNQVSFSGDVVGWVVAGESVSGCYFLSPEKISQVVSSYNLDLASYDRVIFLNSNGAGGCSYVGKTTSYIDGAEYLFSQSSIGIIGYDEDSWWGPQSFTWTNLDFVLAHELGHGLGVMHANGWDCGDETLGSDCQHIEYGNYFDTMGTVGFSLHFNLFYKELLGWIEPSRILSIQNSGTYTVNSLSDQLGIVGAKIKNYRGTATPFYVEFRKAIGFDSNISNIGDNKGLFVNRIILDDYSPKFSFPRLLDTHATNDDWYSDLEEQATLNPGETFSDPKYGISINSVNQTSTSSLSFNVVVTDVPCIFANPGLNVYTDDLSKGISSDGYGYFDIEIINDDSINCSPSSFHVDTLLPEGWVMDSESEDAILAPEKFASRYFYFRPNGAVVGEYTIQVIVTNLQSGLQTVNPLSVEITPEVTITNISPSTGPVGTNVILTGTGFGENGNLVYFEGDAGYTFFENMQSSENGTEISYKIPNSIYSYYENNELIPTPNGNYTISVRSGHSGYAYASFTVGDEIVPPSVVVASSTSLALTYDSNKKESQLTAEVSLSVTAGGRDLYLYKNGSGSFTNQTPSPDDSSNNVPAYYNLSLINGADEETDDYGQAVYIIEEGQTATFEAISSVETKRMFAGSYVAGLRVIYGNYDDSGDNTFNVEVPENKTNSVVIVGELSPYITKITQSPDGTLVVTGKRFATEAKNTVYVGKKAFEKLSSSKNGTEISFKPYGMGSESYPIVVNNTLITDNGYSNYLSFDLKGVPNIPTVTLKYKAASDSDFSQSNGAPLPVGTEVLFNWNSTDATSCTASANPTTSNWTGSKSTVGLGSVGNIDVSRIYKLSCTGPSGTASTTIQIYADGKVVPPPPVPVNPPTVDTSIRLRDIYCNKGDWVGKNSVIGMWNKKTQAYNPDPRFLCHTDKVIYRCATAADEKVVAGVTYWNTFSTKINNGAVTPNYTCDTGAGKWVPKNTTTTSIPKPVSTSNQTATETNTVAKNEVAEETKVEEKATETATETNTTSCGTLNVGSSLTPGQSINSCNNKYRFILQKDGNAVLYDANNKALWHTGTNGKTAKNIIMQSDGNLVIYGTDGGPLWAAMKFGSPSALKVQGDGNLVIYNTSGGVIWNSGSQQSASASDGGTNYATVALSPLQSFIKLIGNLF